MRTLPREKLAASLVHGPRKRNTPIGRDDGLNRCQGMCRLLERDCEPSDQGSDVVQLSRIVPLDRLREQFETLVVGETGDVSRANRGRSLRMVDQDVGHRNQLHREPSTESLDLN